MTATTHLSDAKGDIDDALRNLENENVTSALWNTRMAINALQAAEKKLMEILP